LKARVLLRRAAELDLAAIEDWYNTQQDGLGAEFRGAIADVIRRIGDSPLSYPERHRTNRRALLRRFPYVVWYRVQSDSAIVLLWSRIFVRTEARSLLHISAPALRQILRGACPERTV